MEIARHHDLIRLRASKLLQLPRLSRMLRQHLPRLARGGAAAQQAARPPRRPRNPRHLSPAMATLPWQAQKRNRMAEKSHKILLMPRAAALQVKSDIVQLMCGDDHMLAYCSTEPCICCSPLCRPSAASLYPHWSSVWPKLWPKLGP